MAPLKMSWNKQGGRLASEWVESQGREPYNPAWKQSSYPSEANARRSNSKQLSSLSPFGKTAPFRHSRSI